MQKSLLCKFGLSGESCSDNFNNFNTFGKSSTLSVYVGESSKMKRAEVKNTKDFKRQHAKRKSTKPKFQNLN